MRQYNEPWEISFGNIFDSNNGMVVGRSQVVNDKTFRHIVACVNALAGQEPEKVKKKLELYDAAMHILKRIPYVDELGYGEPWAEDMVELLKQSMEL